MSSDVGQAFLLADNSKSDADVLSKQAVLWAWEQCMRVASFTLQGSCRGCLFLVSGPKCILYHCYIWLLYWYVPYGQIEDHRTIRAFFSSPLLKAYFSFWPKLKLYSQDKHHIMYFHSFHRNVVVVLYLVCICSAPRRAGDAAGSVFAVKGSELHLDSVSSMQTRSICQISDWGWSCRADLRPWINGMILWASPLLKGPKWSVFFLYIFQEDSSTGHISGLKITSTIPISTVWTFWLGSKELKKHYSLLSLASQESY